MIANQKNELRRKEKRVFLTAMLAIPVVHFLVFYLYINFSSFVFAFQDAQGGWTVENFEYFFKELTASDGSVGLALKNTLLYFVVGLCFFPTGIIISYFLYKKILGYKYFRIIFYLPSIISSMVLVTVFKEFVKPWGPVGLIFEACGHPFPAVGLFSLEETATTTIIMYTIWLGLPSNMLMWGGALTRIPQDVLEAACIDGCDIWRELWSIILPLIMPTLSSLFIFSMTGFLGAGGPILLFTNGSAGTSTLNFWMFNQVYSNKSGVEGFYGVLSAAGLFFTAIATPIVLFVRWLAEKIPAVEY